MNENGIMTSTAKLKTNEKVAIEKKNQACYTGG